MTDPQSAPPSPVPSPVEGVLGFFRAQEKTVLTLAGYSGAGYEEPDRTRRKVTRLLDRHDPATTIVNIGATPEGIGRAYLWAKARGFTTTGIVSSVVLSSGSPVSPACDHAFLVEDTVYGGYVDDRLSPTSEAMVTASDLFIAVGGGEITRDEMVEMERRGKPIRFIPADMNHAKARAKAASKGLPEPSPEDLQGAAHARFGHPPDNRES